jgi:hypothetical protein
LLKQSVEEGDELVEHSVPLDTRLRISPSASDSSRLPIL